MPIDPKPAHDAIDALAASAEADAEARVAAQKSADDAVIAELRQELEDAQHPAPVPGPLAGRFPGDPGPGHVIVGLAEDEEAKMTALQKALGKPPARREYSQGGSGTDNGIDAIRPGGETERFIKQNWAAGRVPVVSFKPGQEQMAAHQFHDQLVGFCKRTNDAAKAAGKVVIVIVHHEFENDWKSDAGNLTKYPQHQATSRECQRWFRACLNEACGGRPSNIAFAGCMMTYSWSDQGRKKFGDPNGWDPGKTADGHHVWDMLGLDHYDSRAGSLLKSPMLVAGLAACKAWGVLPAIFEVGVKGSDPQGGAKLTEMFAAIVSLGLVVLLYFSSHPANPTNPLDGWDLVPDHGSRQAFSALATSPVAVYPNA
jgi:hypothetical protein